MWKLHDNAQRPIGCRCSDCQCTRTGWTGFCWGSGHRGQTSSGAVCPGPGSEVTRHTIPQNEEYYKRDLLQKNPYHRWTNCVDWTVYRRTQRFRQNQTNNETLIINVIIMQDLRDCKPDCGNRNIRKCASINIQYCPSLALPEKVEKNWNISQVTIILSPRNTSLFYATEKEKNPISFNNAIGKKYRHPTNRCFLSWANLLHQGNSLLDKPQLSKNNTLTARHRKPSSPQANTGCRKLPRNSSHQRGWRERAN